MKESVSEVLEPIGDKQVKSLIPGATIFFDWVSVVFKVLYSFISSAFKAVTFSY